MLTGSMSSDSPVMQTEPCPNVVLDAPQKEGLLDLVLLLHSPTHKPPLEIMLQTLGICQVYEKQSAYRVFPNEMLRDLSP